MSGSSSQLLPVTRVRGVGPEKGHIGKMDDMAAKHIPCIEPNANDVIDLSQSAVEKRRRPLNFANDVLT